MKRRTQSLSEELTPVVLYKEDIEAIFALMIEVSPKVDIITNDVRWDDLNELWEHRKVPFSDLTIQTRYLEVHLSLNQHSARIYISDDTLNPRGAFEKIKSLLKKRTIPCFRFVPPFVIGGIAVGLLSACLSSGFFAIGRNDWVNAGLLAICLAATFSVCAVLWHFSFHRYSLIIPKPRMEIQGFWSRNSDKLILAVLSALIGCLATLVVKKVSGP